jgi:4-amino-4-deoxy-L-arabinose transferase-like glycosyltransferase
MRVRGATALLLILGLALLARVVVIVATPDYQPLFDAADYDRHGVSIADGHGYPGPQGGPPTEPTAFRPPLYPLALAGVHLLGGGWTAGRLLGAVLGVATVLLVFVISRRLWGQRVALVAGAIVAVFPPLVIFSATLLSESLFLPLMLGVLLAVLQYREDPRLRWALLAGVLCGLAALTRSNGALLVLGAGVGVWILRPKFSRAAVAAPVAVGLAALLVVAPWVARNSLVFDRPVGLSTQGGVVLAGTFNAEARDMADHPGRPRRPWKLDTFRDIYSQGDLDEAERSTRLTSRGLHYIEEHPGYAVETAGWNVLRVFDIVHSGSWRRVLGGPGLQGLGVEPLISPVVPLSAYVLSALALLGVAAQAGVLGRGRRVPAFVWLFPLLMVLPAIAVWGLPRYRAVVDPFLVMLAAMGIVAVAEFVGRRSLSAPPLTAERRPATEA